MPVFDIHFHTHTHTHTILERVHGDTWAPMTRVHGDTCIGTNDIVLYHYGYREVDIGTNPALYHYGYMDIALTAANRCESVAHGGAGH